MKARSISTHAMLTETLRVLPKFLVLVALVGTICLPIYLWLGTPKLLATVVGLFFALVYFSAPIATSALRFKRNLRLLSRAGGLTLLFSFFWGAAVVALFIATLQIWQGMEAMPTDYIVAMAAAGIACAATATIPSGR